MTFILSIGDHVFKIGTTLWWHQTIKKKSYVRVFFYKHTKNDIVTCNIQRCFPKQNTWILNEVQFVSDVQIFPSPTGRLDVLPIIYKGKAMK